MSDLRADDSLSGAGRAVHDLGAAALFGGNLFARSGMHPALRSISEPRERGMVVNRAWRRYGMEPDGAVALKDGSGPEPDTPRRAARAKRLLNVFGAAHLATTGMLVATNASLAQAGFRRPPVRRLLRRSY